MKSKTQPLATLTLPTAHGTERISLLELGEISVSPYLIWAAAIEYRYFALSRRDNEIEIPVLIELNQAQTTDNLDYQQLLKHSSIRVNSLYLNPALYLRESRYLTALVLAGSFFRALRDNKTLRSCVSAIDFCAPIRDKASTAPSSKVRPEPSGLWVDGFTDDKYDELCNNSSGSKQELILGIADDSIAFLNQKFSIPNKDQTRFLAYWDQNNQTDRWVYAASTPATEPGYGIELNQSVINDMLADDLDEATHYSRINPHRLSAGRTHGTAVLGVANSYFNPHLIAVQLPFPSSGDDDSGLGLGTAILDAVRFMIDRSDAWWREQRKKQPSLSLPKLVVNISYGKQAGPHDGSSLIERALDELINLRTLDGVAHLKIVFSAGNDHDVQCHAHIDKLPAGKQGDICWQILPDDATPSFLEVYIVGDSSSVTVELIAPNGRVITNQPLRPGDAEHVNHSEGEATSSVVHLPNTTGAGSIVLVSLPSTHRGGVDSGEWRLKLRNSGTQNVKVLAWVQGDNSRPDQPRRGRQSFLLNGRGKFDARVSDSNTLNALSTGKLTLRAGALVRSTQKPASYSSRGPEETPVTYFPVDPSENQPGKQVIGTFTGSHARMGGTSIAAPQLTRWVLKEWACKSTDGYD